jgi:hypothetical protein
VLLIVEIFQLHVLAFNLNRKLVLLLRIVKHSAEGV